MKQRGAKKVMRISRLLSLGVLSCTLLCATPSEAQIPSAIPSLFKLLDTDRWERLRPIPPFDRDGGFALLDALEGSTPRLDSLSLQSKPSSLQRAMRVLEPLLVGKTFQWGSRWEYSVDGLVFMFPEVNEYDGLWLGYEFLLKYKLGQGKSLNLRASNNWALKSRQWYTENHLIHYYAPKRDGVLILSGGYTTRNTTYESATEMVQMRYPTPLGTNSGLRDYRKAFVSLRNSFFLTPHLYTNILGLYEERTHHLALEPRSQALIGQVSLLYDFALRAPTSGKYPSGYQTPVGYHSLAIGLSYRGSWGMPKLLHREGQPTSRFSSMELSLHSAFALTSHLKLTGYAALGHFFDRKRLAVADYQYFQEVSALDIRPLHYSWATFSSPRGMDKSWGVTHLNLVSDNLLLTRTKFGSRGWMMDEALHAKWLTDWRGVGYLEGGYSIGWGRLARMGLFVGTDFSGGCNLSVKFNFPITRFNSLWGERY